MSLFKTTKTIVAVSGIVFLLMICSICFAEQENVRNAVYNAPVPENALMPAQNYLLLEEDASVIPTALDDRVANKRTSEGYLFKHRLLRKIIAEQEYKRSH